MSNDNGGSNFERRTKRAFDDSVAALDAATRSKLTQARHRALEDAGRDARGRAMQGAIAEQASARDRGFRSSLLPAGAVAATALVAFLVVWQATPPAPVPQAAALSDLEILLGEEDLKMLDEEIEFYGWLEEQPEFANVDSVG